MEIKKWLGLRNTTGPEAIRPGGLERALDVDIDDAGAIRTRDGRAVASASGSHSLFSAGDVSLVVQGYELRRFTPPASLSTLKRLRSDEPMAYAERDGVIYFTNGLDTGRVTDGEVKEWGVRAPTGNPAAGPAAGNLQPARYLYAITYARADGVESGHPVPAAIELTERGGIEFSDIPTSSDPDVIGRMLYLSGPNGAELYMAAWIPAAAASYTHAGDTPLGTPLDPDHVSPAPAGTALEFHAGRMLVAQGDIVWISEQFGYERFRMAHSFLAFPGEVTLLASVTDGLYVGTDRATYYLAGNDLSQAKAARAADHAATPGTLVKMDVSLEATEEEQAPATVVAALWMSPEGVILGMPGGTIRNLTTGDFNVAAGVRGAALLRSARGYTSYVATVLGETAPANAF